VYLFVDGQVAAELTYQDFEAHVERQTEIPGTPPGVRVCRAGFASIGPELRVQGMVFFLLQIDDFGRPDKNFNVPLPYLAGSAEDGPDLGYGPVKMACREGCTVPWHANNLWNPLQDDVTSPITAMVAAIENNKLEFSPVAPSDEESPEHSADADARIAEMSDAHQAELAEQRCAHEAALEEQSAVLEAKIELYRGEVARLKEELAQRAGDDQQASNG